LTTINPSYNTLQKSGCVQALSGKIYGKTFIKQIYYAYIIPSNNRDKLRFFGTERKNWLANVRPPLRFAVQIG
jgi:hypothetical protein